MPKPIRIVTDSSAHFVDPKVVQRYKISVIPLEVQFAARTYREDIDLDAEGFFQRVNNTEYMPLLHAPSKDRFADLYNSLRQETDQILSLHLPRSMHPTWTNAKAAADTLLGRCAISVVDAETTSVGLGMLVEAAAKLTETTNSLPEVVRIVRKLVPRVYSIFFVETFRYLRRSGMVSESQAILGAMLGIKPFLTIEEGDLVTMEKVRTRSQAVDRLVEYVTEFGAIEQLIILQNAKYPTESTRALQERLITECGLKSFSTVMYKPSLGCFLGPDAMGIVIYEGESAINLEHDDETL